MKRTIKGYTITEPTDGTNYVKKLLKLHTKDEKAKEQFHKKFNELLSISKEIINLDFYENQICDKSLYWISNFFQTFEEQQNWLSSFEYMIKDMMRDGSDKWYGYSWKIKDGNK